MDDNGTIISLRHVRKEFGSFAAVSDFHLDIKKGEFVTLLGPSGCGKSTTLRMIAGFDIPTSGEILLNGEDITRLPPYKRPINTVFQHYALFPNLDVYDNIAFGLKLKKVPVEVTKKNGEKVTKLKHLSAAEIDTRVARALKIVDLEEMEDRDVNSLSGGQQQRVAIARAIVNEPKVLLLDEPLSALDHKMRLEMQLELKEMHNKLGITFIYVTHDQEEALTMSDKVVVMRDGEIEQIGTPEEIYNEPANAFVADFIGESNIYNGVMAQKKKVRFLGGLWECVDDFPVNERVDVVIRPEDVILGEKGKGVVDAKIVSRVFKGEDYAYVLHVGKFEVLVRSHKAYPIDSEVSIDCEAENIQIMKKDMVENEWRDAFINKNGEVEIGEYAFEVDLTQIIKGSTLDEDGCVVDPKNGKKYDFTDAEVIATCSFDCLEVFDDLSKGVGKGTLIQCLWKGDHYQDIIRTEEEEEDFVFNTPYEWNEGDIVAFEIDKSAIKLKLKKELEEYEVK